MRLNIFDNTSGYRPSHDLISWWLLLPQNSTTYHGTKAGEAGKRISPLFADPKSVVIHFVLIAILIIAELTLIFQLEDNGVDYKVLLILSIIDFVVAILPMLITKKWTTVAEINARIFIAEANIELNQYDSTITEQERTTTKKNLKDNLGMWQSKLMPHKILNIVTVMVILIFSAWKFASFYAVLGSDIFVEPVGRFVMGVIFLSIVVHLLSTKIVFVASAFYPKLKNEIKKHSRFNDHSIAVAEINKPKEIEHKGKYKPSISLHQRIVQKINYWQEETEVKESHKNEYLLLPNGDIQNKYKIDNFEGFNNINIVTTGLLTDPEIQGLFSSQGDSEQLQVIATCKGIQLTQI